MGLWLVDLLTDMQLAAAAMRYQLRGGDPIHFQVPFTQLRQAWANHWNRVVRMPAGGAHGGGSMQTGFEMELLPLAAALELMKGWPNHQQQPRGGHSWEARTMKEAGEMLRFGETGGWGVFNAKPIPLLPKAREHRGILIVPPPVTVTYRSRSDGTTSLTVRAPLTIWNEDNTMILPPDDADNNPFYLDPPGRPGMHRDIFKAWARNMMGELILLQYPMSAQALTHLPKDYESESSFEEEEDGRSVSSWRSSWGKRSVNSSDWEDMALHCSGTDSSEEEGAPLD